MVYRPSLIGPVFGLRREIDRLFEDTFGREGTRTGWAPAVDVREDEDAIVLEVELPGIRPEDVEVTAENGVLTVRGEKQTVSKEGGGEGRFHLVERTYGAFVRSFQLPANMDESAIEAEFDNGLLTVRVPKSEAPQARRIQIRNSGSQPVIQGPGSAGGRSQGGSTSSGELARGGGGTSEGAAGPGGVGQGTGGQGAQSRGGSGTAPGSARNAGSGSGTRGGSAQSAAGSSTRGGSAQGGASGRSSGTSGSSRTNTRGGR